MAKSFFEIDDGFVVLTLDKDVYELDVIFSAAYQLLDTAYVVLNKTDDGLIEVRLSYQDETQVTEKALSVLAKDFYNSLVDYKFYQLNSSAKEKTRSLVLEKSLRYEVSPESVQAGQECPAPAAADGTMAPAPQESEFEEISDDDLEFEDPEGIAIPWEEKYSSDSKE